MHRDAAVRVLAVFVVSPVADRALEALADYLEEVVVVDLEIWDLEDVAPAVVVGNHVDFARGCPIVLGVVSGQHLVQMVGVVAVGADEQQSGLVVEAVVAQLVAETLIPVAWCSTKDSPLRLVAAVLQRLLQRGVGLVLKQLE